VLRTPPAAQSYFEDEDAEAASAVYAELEAIEKVPHS
jgi:hypothetical protein